MKTIIVLLSLVAFVPSIQAASHYYPKAVQDQFLQEDVQNEELTAIIFNVLSSRHQRNNSGPDTLGCNGKRGNCYSQQSLGYRGAKRALFGTLHLEEDSRGYYVKDIYCRKEYSESQQNIGPGKIPNHQVINCEHTWPQSRFSTKFSKGLQKSDLHHLYPADSKVNSVRGHYEFGNVRKSKTLKNCDASKSQKGSNYFEPPEEHKGNVARAIFYFSVRYQIDISSREEKVLRQWNLLDPIDHEEEVRNDKIFELQGNRNPFIDFPQLVDKISNF